MSSSPKPRQVAVAIAYRLSPDHQVEVCLVTSRKHVDKWVLPKGGVEEGEDVGMAARRELWEEAGVRSTATFSSTFSSSSSSSSSSPPLNRPPTLTTLLDHKPHRSSPTADPCHLTFVPRAIYTAVEIRMDGDGDTEMIQGKEEGEERWPESHERRRKWVRYEEACEMIRWRRDVYTLLRSSSLA